MAATEEALAMTTSRIRQAITTLCNRSLAEQSEEQVIMASAKAAGFLSQLSKAEDLDGKTADYEERIRTFQVTARARLVELLAERPPGEPPLGAEPVADASASMQTTEPGSEPAAASSSDGDRRLLQALRRLMTNVASTESAESSTGGGRADRSGFAALLGGPERPPEDPSVELGAGLHEPAERKPAAGAAGRTFEEIRRAGYARFEGDFEHWPAFWESFEVEIHLNGRLTDDEKLRLMKELTVPAVNKMLGGGRASGMPYQEAVRLMRRTYDRPEKARDAILARLRAQPRIAGDDSDALTVFTAEARTARHSLASYDLPGVQHEQAFAAAVYAAVPDEVRRALGQRPDHTPDAVLEELELQLRLMERNERIYEVSRLTKRRPQVAERRACHAVAVDKDDQRPCAYCGSCEHRPVECTHLRTIKERRIFVTNFGRCWYCLEKHQLRDCPLEVVRCECGVNHHLSICPKYGERAAEEAVRAAGKTSLAHLISAGDGGAAEDDPSVERIYLHAVRADATLGERQLPCFTEDGESRLMTMLLQCGGAEGGGMMRVLLDTGALLSLVSRRTVERFGLRTVRVPAVRLMLAGNLPGPRTDQTASVPIARRGGRPVGEVLAYVVDEVTQPMPSFLDTRLRGAIAALQIEVDDCTTGKEARATPMEMIIGINSLNKLCTGKQVDLPNGLRAHETRVGWCLGGTDREAIGQRAARLLLTRPEHGEETADLLEDEPVLTREQEAAQSRLIEQAERSLEMRQHRYWIGLPWLSTERLDNNLRNALQRLRRLVTRLHASGEYAAYEAQLLELVREGHAERVEFSEDSGGYFMPHRGIARPGAVSSKLRIVFDASSAAAGQDSLNDRLAKGVDLNPRVSALLTAFRVGRVAAVGDLKKAFLQIRLRENDRNFLRFLWIGPKGQLQAYRMTSVPFGATCSPFLLATVIRRHLANSIGRWPLVKHLIGRVYVDDALLSADTAAELSAIREESVAAFQECQMELHKWRSSDPVLDRQWAGMEAEAEAKVLGVWWCPAEDYLRIALPVIDMPVCTRRAMLSQLGGIYDPVGLCTPAVVPLKLLVREALRDGCDWDVPVPEDLASRFRKIVSGLPMLEQARVARLAVADPETTGLALFVDASGRALAAVVYAVDLTGIRPPVLLCSRSRMAETRTIPELELRAACVGAELLREAGQRTGCLRWCCWSDSSVALDWIRAHPNKTKRPYVSNRVREILDITSVGQWRHISGQTNPADVLSRGATAAALLKHGCWWTGPAELLTCPTERFITRVADRAVLSVVRTVEPVASGLEWSRILDQARGRLACAGEANPSRAAVLKEVWRTEQLAAFPEEVVALRGGHAVPGDSRLNKYCPFLDADGLVRSRTRMRSTDVDFETPLVLDADRPAVRAWLVYLHGKLYHLGAHALKAHVGEHHIVFGLSTVARRVVAACVDCVRIHGRPMSQPAGLLPKERLRGGDAFRAIAVDFFGPIMLSAKCKRYVLLATCMAARAVHLELLPGMKAWDVWEGFRRMFARRGVPSVIFSDNGPGFVSAAGQMRELQAGLEVSQREAPPTIAWKFQSASAPWQGGVFERLVGTVKVHLPVTARGVHLTERSLITALAEVEAVVNSRPIGLLESGEVLTPGHLCIGRRPLYWPGLDGSLPGAPASVREEYKQREKLLGAFWVDWRRTYLAALPGRFRSGDPVRPISLGMKVVVYDAHAKRCDWPVGEVIELLPDAEGVVRNVVLDIGGVRHSRPVQRLSLIGDM